MALNDNHSASISFKKQLRATRVTGDRVGRTQALDGLTECYASSSSLSSTLVLHL